MQITFLGQAGLFVETRYGSILCDPWFNPAFFASWFPFPSNERIDPQAIGKPDYLYVSHLHHDHFDPKFLREHVSKEATVLLPDYPIDHLEKELRALGFGNFIHTKNAEPVDFGGLRFAILALVAPTDGPIGDSALLVDDGATRIFNQNDSHPLDLDVLSAMGPFDAHVPAGIQGQATAGHRRDQGRVAAGAGGHPVLAPGEARAALVTGRPDLPRSERSRPAGLRLGSGRHRLHGSDGVPVDR